MLKIARRHGPREGFVGAASEALFLWCYVMRGFLGAEIHSRRQQLQLDSAGGGASMPGCGTWGPFVAGDGPLALTVMLQRIRIVGRACFPRREKGHERHHGAGEGETPGRLSLARISLWGRVARSRSPRLALCLRREGRPRPQARMAPWGRRLAPACPGPSCFGTEGPALWETPGPLANPGVGRPTWRKPLLR